MSAPPTVTSRRPRIVITGSSGFIGKALTRTLARDYDVWGIDQNPAPGEQVVRANLLDAGATRDALAQLAPYDALIHLAALAHGQRPPAPDTVRSINTRITANILVAVGDDCRHFLFMSSVAVYGEDGRRAPIDEKADLRPSTDYGVSKQECERMILETRLPDVDIMRLAPVYDDDHMADIRKRAFLPGVPFKIKLSPPPLYSFCNIRTLITVVEAQIRRGPAGRSIQNVADAHPMTQHEVANLFDGAVVPIPVMLTRPLYWIAKLVPGRAGYSIRNLYWKLFRSNVYVTRV